jgi:hypothetical protein
LFGRISVLLLTLIGLVWVVVVVPFVSKKCADEALRALTMRSLVHILIVPSEDPVAKKEPFEFQPRETTVDRWP